MDEYYVRRVFDRLYQVVWNIEGEEPEVVGIWSHPELAQEDADRLNRKDR